MSEPREYSTCPFCGSNAIGPSYTKYEFRGQTYHTAAIGCADCAAHGPVRNDYPADPVANGAKADEVESWIKTAWNRLPAVTPQEASALDIRSLSNAPDTGMVGVSQQQLSIAMAKLYSGGGPGDDMWCELDYQALEFALGYPVERKPIGVLLAGE